MKRKRKQTLILGIVLFLLGIATSPSITESRVVVGKYVTGDPDEYLYIKKDGTFYLKEKGKYFHIVGAPENTGKWKVEKGEIIFSHPLGIVTRWKIKPNVLIGEEGKTWFIEGSVPQSIRGVSKESVVGTYIDKGVDAELLIKPDGKYIYKRKGFPTFDGVWELNGNQIKLYPFILIGSKKQKVEDPGLIMSGEIIGQVLQTTGGLRLVKQIGQPPVIQKPESSPLQTKEDLIAVLQELKDSMLFKIDTDIQNTAQAFTDVKDYWRIKRWADLARVPLRAIQHALSLVAKASDLSMLSEQLPKSFGQSQSIAELIALGMMVQSIKETGGKLSYAVHGPFYESSIEAMLKKADATQMPLSGFEPKYYKQVIENHLFGGVENSPLIIPRKTITFPKKTLEVAKGALQVKKIIMNSFKDLLSQLQRVQLPANFPLDEMVAQLRETKTKIMNSTNNAIKIAYPIQKGNLKTEVNLGCTGSLYRAFALVAGNLAKNIELQESAEYLSLSSTAGDLLVLSFTFRGGRESVIAVQQIDMVGKIVINGKKVLRKDPEEEFYMVPQAMLHSLPVELSNLLAISDGTIQYLRDVLSVGKSEPVTKTEKSYVAAPAAPAPSPSPSTKGPEKPAEAPTPTTPPQAPQPAKYPELPGKVVEAFYEVITSGNCLEARKYFTTDSFRAIEKNFKDDGFQTFEEGCRETMVKSLSGLHVKIRGVEIEGTKAVVSFDEYRKDGKLLNHEKAHLAKEKGLWKILWKKEAETKTKASQPPPEAPQAAPAPAPESAKPSEQPPPAPTPTPAPSSPTPQPPRTLEDIFKILKVPRK